MLPHIGQKSFSTSGTAIQALNTRKRISRKGLTGSAKRRYIHIGLNVIRLNRLMHTLRKLALGFLVLPLALNGLWMICRDAPPQPQAAESAQTQASRADQQLQEECARLCARQSALCLTSAGDKTSVTIVVFGIAIFPPQTQLSSPSVTRRAAADRFDFHSDPSIAHPSPPPEG